MADESINTSIQPSPSAGDPDKTSKRVLEPPERIAEVLFGLIMVLTFTCSFSVANSDRIELRQMLVGALGCNAAWGIIDGIFYLMSCLSERGRNLAILRALRRATDLQQAHHVMADALPPTVVSVMAEAEFEELRRRLNQLPEPPDKPQLKRDDWRGAVGNMLLVFLSTLPPTIPFMVLENSRLALRISNWLAVTMLFGLGYAYGRYAEHRPWRWAFSMVGLGALMVALTISLGG